MISSLSSQSTVLVWIDGSMHISSKIFFLYKHLESQGKYPVLVTRSNKVKKFLFELLSINKELFFCSSLFILVTKKMLAKAIEK